MSKTTDCVSSWCFSFFAVDAINARAIMSTGRVDLVMNATSSLLARDASARSRVAGRGPTIVAAEMMQLRSL